MLQEQCISVTDLRTKTKKCLENLKKEPKYIFLNNKPIAVLIDISQYGHDFFFPELRELSHDEVDAKMLKKAATAKKLKKHQLINIK